MGYYTSHTLKTEKSEHFEQIKTALEEISGYGSGLFESEYKWYDCEDHCLEVSKQHPEVLFLINGQGEEPDDTWQKRYLKGECVSEWRKQAVAPPDFQEGSAR